MDYRALVAGFLGIIIGALAGLYVGYDIGYERAQGKSAQITGFEECVAAGNPVMESYPRQCRANGKTFVEVIKNISQATEPLVLSPQPDAVVQSPLEIVGSAPATWFFEAVFPIYILDAQGDQIAQGVAQAQGDWMAEDSLVPFGASLTFDTPASGSGELVLQKDNPSGLPQNTQEVRIPIKF